ncbi:MAG: phosphate ABC transporter permease PstA [Flavobacteriales bacterium]
MTNEKINRIKDTAFKYFGVFATLLGIVLLAVFIINILIQGIARVDLDFLTSFPSRFPEKAGILSAWTGTIWIFCLTAIIAIPLGVAAGIYLEEYAGNNRLANILEINIANLAGVPSILYGILGLQIFVRVMNLGGSLLAGAFTLALLILPIIIVSTREALKSIPNYIREASYGIGASKWQTIWYQVLPAAKGNIITGIILALARAIGETAPLIVIGALSYVPFTPSSPMDEFTVLPMQIFNWVSRPQHGFAIDAAAAIIILLVLVLFLNGIAVYLRYRAQKKFKY